MIYIVTMFIILALVFFGTLVHSYSKLPSGDHVWFKDNNMIYWKCKSCGVYLHYLYTFRGKGFVRYYSSRRYIAWHPSRLYIGTYDCPVPTCSAVKMDEALE